jgi:hypothetical protein
MSPLTTKSTKSESRIQDATKHNLKIKSQRKAQECHLEGGKTARPIKRMKNDKPSQNDKYELRNAQNQNRTKKAQTQKLKTLILSMQSLLLR